MNAKECLESRRSIRKYKADAIPVKNVETVGINTMKHLQWGIDQHFQHPNN